MHEPAQELGSHLRHITGHDQVPLGIPNRKGRVDLESGRRRGAMSSTTG
jgi:hypothetical protein